MHFSEYVRFTEVSVVFLFAAYLFNPILSPYVKSLGFSDMQVSWIFSLLPISIIIFSPIMGALSDSIGRKKVITIGIAFEMIAILLYAFGSSWIEIGLAKVLDAIGVVVVSLITLAKIEDSLDGKERGKYTGWSLSVRYLGSLIGPVVGAVMASTIFMRAPFFASFVILSVLLMFVVQKESKGHKKTRISLNPIRDVKEFLSFKKLKGMGILGIVMHATNPAMQVFLPLLIVEKLGLNISYVGYAYFFLGLTHLIQFKFGELSDRYKPWKVLLIGCAISATGLAFLPLSHNFVLLASVLFLMGIGNSMWNVSAWNLMSDVGEKVKEEGEIVTSYISIAKIGAFVSFVLSGLVVTYFGMNSLFLMNSLFIFMGILTSYFFFKDN
ncbi:MAG: MFS transporter [Candidatus Aenigmarchaeota archaeon]|nr:MFS transporter [Candidatus Aenigmarchaeota archaeon]